MAQRVRETPDKEMVLAVLDCAINGVNFKNASHDLGVKEDELRKATDDCERANGFVEKYELLIWHARNLRAQSPLLAQRYREKWQFAEKLLDRPHRTRLQALMPLLMDPASHKLHNKQLGALLTPAVSEHSVKDLMQVMFGHLRDESADIGRPDIRSALIGHYVLAGEATAI